MFVKDIKGKNIISSNERHFHFTHETNKTPTVIKLSVYCLEMLSVLLHPE